MSYFRHPKTYQEKKKYYDTKDLFREYQIRVRGRRKPVWLPSVWDDVITPDHRCWKRFRAKQYKYK